MSGARWWRKLRRLGPRQAVLLAQCLVLLPVVATLTRVAGVATAMSALCRVPGARWLRAGPDGLAAAVELAAVAERAARVSPWPPSCLQRSMLLWWLAQRRGIAVDLRIGVRRDPGAEHPAFHAWVELDGYVLNDRPRVASEHAVLDITGMLPATQDVTRQAREPT